ncbi:hypothetical protein CAPTEDRAFT_208565, partial [Capitella teleta]
MGKSRSYHDGLSAYLKKDFQWDDWSHRTTPPRVTLILPDKSTLTCLESALTNASNFFKAEVTSNPGQEIKLNFSDSTTIRTVVDYLNNNTIIISDENFEKLLVASDFINLTNLKGHLSSFWRDTIDSTNCIEFYKLARKHKAQYFYHKSLEFILSNFIEVCCSSDNIEELSEEEMIEVVSDHRLAVDDEDIVHDTVVR